MMYQIIPSVESEEECAVLVWLVGFQVLMACGLGKLAFTDETGAKVNALYDLS